MVIYVVSLLYTQCLRYNICSAWFLDIRISTCCPIENVQEIWPTKIDFGRPNAEIGWKMTDSRLLLLALLYKLLLTT